MLRYTNHNFHNLYIYMGFAFNVQVVFLWSFIFDKFQFKIYSIFFRLFQQTCMLFLATGQFKCLLKMLLIISGIIFQKYLPLFNHNNKYLLFYIFLFYYCFLTMALQYYPTSVYQHYHYHSTI